MTHDDAFLRDIIENPDDDGVRLIYADWLEDDGQPKRAEFIRMWCELARVPGGERRADLEARCGELSSAHRDDWVDHFGVAMTWENALSVFAWRLAGTMAWCRGRGVESLRTPALEPATLMGGMVSSGVGQRYYASPSTAECEAIVNGLANRRAKLCGGAQESAGGRLLYFDPKGALSDEAAAVESGGFFDPDNVPAWDTWVWFAADDSRPGGGWTPMASHLVAWVPRELVGLADAGIRVNPEQCIMWASDVDNGFTRRLRAAGLLS